MIGWSADQAGAAASLAQEFDRALAEVIGVAETLDDDDWARFCPGEERTVGVLFDHIAAGNDQTVEWVNSFLGGRPVDVSPEKLAVENATHAGHAARRPRATTMELLRTSMARTSRFLHALKDEQLTVREAFGWLGTQDVAFVVRQGCRHPQRHLQSIREALRA